MTQRTDDAQPPGAEVTHEPADQGPADGYDVVAQGQLYRNEIFAHCYRMTGSVHEAEDLVQETYLRAWRGRTGFQGRSSVRTWLHRIATNACLSALEGRSRRPLPTGLGAPASDPSGSLDPRPEVTWLEPVPDSFVGLGGGSAADAADPGALAVDRESVRLAFVAALQFLPPQQRAVLLLREVLAWRAAEVAELLQTSEAAVNSSLQRARAELARVKPQADALAEPESPRMQALLDQYMAAFENYDMSSLVSVFTTDVVWEMPPYAGWYQGADAVVELIKTNCPASKADDQRMVPICANGQPGFALYMIDEDSLHHAFQLQVLTLTDAGVSHVTVFFGTKLFEDFGLPLVLEGGGEPRGSRYHQLT